MVQTRSLIAVYLMLAFLGDQSDAAHFRRGDANADGELDISDPIVLLNFLFVSDIGIPCFDAADANDDGAADVSDAIALLQHLFLSGSPLREPLAACGADPTADELGCESFPPCPPIQSRQVWTTRYNGPGHSFSSPAAIATGESGSIYVTGGSNGEFATIKYDAEGHLIWEARYRGPGTSGSSAISLAVDGGGNVHITGESYGEETSADYATVKYSAGGRQIWAKRYNGPGNGKDRPVSVAADGAGNVYVTGYSEGDGTGYDIATIKYDALGRELWVARFNGPGNGGDFAAGLALDGENNAYVAGSSVDDRNLRHFITIKYDPEGNLLWTARYDEPSSKGSGATCLAIDGDGNLLVSGASSDDASGIVTIKYDKRGNTIWTARYPDADGVDDSPTKLAIDRTGNIFVVGISGLVPGGELGDYGDYLTIKYDAGGNLLWSDLYDGTDGMDYPVDVVVDSDGNAYVTGISKGTTYFFDLATIKYDAWGNRVWVVRREGTYIGYGNATRAIVVDRSGNVIVTGTKDESSYFRPYETIKYDSNGNPLWTAAYHRPGFSDDRAYGIAVDPLGNIAIAGTSDDEFTAIQYDSTGRALWEARFSRPDGHGEGVATHIAADTAGNFYVAGHTEGSSSESDYTTVKYDSNGRQLWSAIFQGPGASEDYVTGLAVDGGGDVYVTGYSRLDRAADFVTIKYGPDGAEAWMARYDGPGNGYDAALGLAVDGRGNVLVTGSSTGLDGNLDFTTIKYGAGGDVLWIKRFDGPQHLDDWALQLAVDPLDNVHVAGNSGKTAEDADGVVIKYDPDGNEIWLARLNEHEVGSSLGFSEMALDSAGNIYLTGTVYEADHKLYDFLTVKVDPRGNLIWKARYDGPGNGGDAAKGLVLDGSGGLTVTGSSWGAGTDYDYSTIRYDANGNLLWMERYDGPDSLMDMPQGLAADAAGNVYVTGMSSQGYSGNYDFLTIKYRP